MTIQSGMPTYPHDPLETTDYNKTKYSGNYGSLSTSEVIIGYNNITLTDSSLVNTEGTTKLCLRSSRDIEGTSPDGTEYVIVYFAEEEVHAPLLYVTYTYIPEEEGTSSGGDTGNGAKETTLPEITVPKFHIPIWGYYLILGSVFVVALASLFSKAPRSKHGPRGVRVKKNQRRYPKRNKKGKFIK